MFDKFDLYTCALRLVCNKQMHKICNTQIANTQQKHAHNRAMKILKKISCVLTLNCLFLVILFGFYLAFILLRYLPMQHQMPADYQ